MAEETTPQTGQGAATPPADTSQQADDQQTESQEVAPSRDDRSPEDIEAYWKKRQSQEASAFAAKEQALRQQLADLESQVKGREVDKAKKDAADQTEVERLRQMNQTLQQQMDNLQKQAVAETRKAKYPNAAESIEESILTQMDEANLAALNEKLKVNISGGGAPTQRMDANQAARPQAGSSKPRSEKTADELKADLAAMAPAFAEQLKGN